MYLGIIDTQRGRRLLDFYVPYEERPFSAYRICVAAPCTLICHVRIRDVEDCFSELCDGYNVVHWNCIHFANAFLEKLELRMAERRRQKMRRNRVEHRSHPSRRCADITHGGQSFRRAYDPRSRLVCKKFHTAVYLQSKLVCLRRIDVVLFMQMNASGGGEDDGLARYYVRIRRELAVNSDITINCGQADLVAKLAPYLRDAVIVERIEFSPGLSKIEPVRIYINYLVLSEGLIELLRLTFRRTYVTAEASFVKWHFQQGVGITDFLSCFARFAAKIVYTDDLQGWDDPSGEMFNVLDDSILMSMRKAGVRGLDVDVDTIPYALTTNGVFDFCFDGLSYF
ncbi:hypothetical protein AAVH_20192 [Aphelenchoides avenae]|nr:hypothetical protein AAVH_20192 [Aphelenchus avenae]